MLKKVSIFFVVLSVLFTFSSCIDEPDVVQDPEIKAIDDYLAQTAAGSTVLSDHATGMRILVPVYGQEPPPHEGQIVEIYVTGRLFSDKSIFTQGTITEKIEDIEPFGLRYGIASLMGGSFATLYVPSKHAFGPEGTTGVPPNSIIIYEVEVLEITKTPSELEQFQQDTATIAQYIEDNQITNVTEHHSGVFYAIQEQGTGVKPHVYSFIDASYTLKSLSTGQIIEQGALSNQSIFGLVDGLKVGIPLLNKKGKGTFYIPSTLAYGKDGVGIIPASANLIFEITLNEVYQ